ncbi:hypothetical protein [Streptomyces phytophilus]|uniref:hypothetical protein n=1 Tax=Streptomyces phytophilus TaxID=722715 RepID=UPI0015EFF16E|nr:hypothetical protein [Streptomyces phytophilus]
MLAHFGVWRAVKGAVVSVFAVWVCSRILVEGFDITRERASGSWGLDPTPLIALAVSVVAMPVVLWAGMRVLRERRNAPLVWLMTVSWLFAGGYFFDTLDGVGAHIPAAVFAGYAAGGGFVAWCATGVGR